MTLQAINKDRRKFVRYAVTGRIEGTLLDSGQKPITYIINDISQNGLGMVVESQVKPGDFLVFVFNQAEGKKIELKVEVRWVKTSNRKDATDASSSNQVFYCGLSIKNEDFDFTGYADNLDSIFLEAMD